MRVRENRADVPARPGRIWTSDKGGAGGVTDWIGAAEAAQRLGIKQASLYSYVSRGILSRRTGRDGRASLFDPDEITALRRRGRPRREPGGAELVIETSLTEIAGGRLWYRGLDATALAGTRTFEEVAGLLWTGSFAGAAAPWRATGEAIATGSAAQAALPAGTLALERLQVIVPALAATDPLRLQLDPPAVIAAARGLIAGLVSCLPLAGPAAPGGQSIAVQLTARLSPEPGPPGLTATVQAALVLLADHELAASTLAARVAASMRADPYAVVATGLGAVGGALHGGASLGAELMLAAARTPSDAPHVVGDLLRRGERIPGFGHFVYETGDPRAVCLLEMIRNLAPGSPRLAVADAVLAEASRRALPEPNIDFALAALADVAGLIRGAGEAIFAVARTAGWLAHALEEYARKTPIRPRGIYTGPPGTGGRGDDRD
jgi:citrate synthase